MTTQEKKQPQRRCVGCGNHFPKSELVRVVRTPDGAILLDKTGKQNGRGAYICPSAACLTRVRKTGKLGQNLDCTIPPEIYDCLLEEIGRL